jgi:hypothetical protein
MKRVKAGGSAMASKRLGALVDHLSFGRHSAPHSTASAAATADAPQELVLLDDAQMKEYIKTGIHMILPDSPGMPDLATHTANWEAACAMQEDAAAGVRSIGDNVVSSIPGVRTLLKSSAVRGALESVLGQGFAVHPHHFMHMTSPSTDQFWHKDSGRPWGGRKMRHHHSVEGMLLYCKS